MTIACKFGGTSLADAAQFRKVASIIKADAHRRAVVVSAPGKRHKQDPKVTDILLSIHEMVARDMDPENFDWRRETYEFVSDRPALDLLAGSDALRRALEGDGGLEEWVSSWSRDEETFRAEREPFLLYPERED